MTHDSEKVQKRRPRRRKTPYIPNLAEFSFRPSHDWSREEASRLYDARLQSSQHLPIDEVFFEDCISGMKTLPPDSIDLVIADPPFGISFDGKSSVYNRDETLVVEGYKEATGSYDQFTQEWIAEIPRLMKPESSVYIFSGWTNLGSVLNATDRAGLHLLNHIIWHYPFGVYTKRRFVTSHYHILLLVKNPKKYFFNKIENYPQDVWVIKRMYQAGRSKNSTRLPLDVVSRCIDFSSRPGDVVLDPFMGNGTTALAAKANFRHFVGFEVNRRLKRLIATELTRVSAGQDYTPYTDRLPSLEELAERYPRAYREYLKRQEEK
ncbi:MAG: DNA-methyltransferase [Candidatus Thorarchaeota archaeon]